MSSQKKDNSHSDSNYSSSHNYHQEDHYQDYDEKDEIEFLGGIVENKKQPYVQLLSGNRYTRINNTIFDTGLASENLTDMENQNSHNKNNTSEKDLNVQEFKKQDNSNYSTLTSHFQHQTIIDINHENFINGIQKKAQKYSTSTSHFQHQTIIDINHENFINGIQKKAKKYSTSTSHFQHQTIIDINHENFINGIQKKLKKNCNQQQHIIDLQVQDQKIKDAYVSINNQQINNTQESANININLVTPDTIIYQQHYWQVPEPSFVNSQPQMNMIEQIEIEEDRTEAYDQLTYLYSPTDPGIEQEDDLNDDYDDDEDQQHDDWYEEDEDDNDNIRPAYTAITVFILGRPEIRFQFYDDFQKGI